VLQKKNICQLCLTFADNFKTKAHSQKWNQSSRSEVALFSTECLSASHLTRLIIIIIIIIIIITDLYSAFRSEDTEALDAARED